MLIIGLVIAVLVLLIALLLMPGAGTYADAWYV